MFGLQTYGGGSNYYANSFGGSAQNAAYVNGTPPSVNWGLFAVCGPFRL